MFGNIPGHARYRHDDGLRGQSGTRPNNDSLGSTLNPAAVQHPDKVHPSGIESVKGQRADFLGHGKKQLQARKFEFLSDAGRGGVLHGCPKDNYIVI